LPYTGEVAAEPGLDYRRMDIDGFDYPVDVTVTDFSAQQYAISKKLQGVDELEEFFSTERPDWAKVRWINVDGLNWKSIKFLALKYGLHRLAIEDMLTVQRTKIDLYKDRKEPNNLLHLRLDTYVCLLMHCLVADDEVIDREEAVLHAHTHEQPNRGSFFSKMKHWWTSNDRKADKEPAGALANYTFERKGSITIAQHYNPDRSLIHEQARSRDSNLTVAVEQVSIFLTSDGTVLSFFQVSTVEVLLLILAIRASGTAPDFGTVEVP
jgi:Mg2+ and Co2+ transporter CorA